MRHEKNNLSAYILASDKVSYIAERKTMHVGDIINIIEVPLVPYACKTSFYIKIMNLLIHQTIDYSIKLVDSEGVILASTSPIVLRNMRAQDQVPGVDTAMDITYVVCAAGIMEVQLIINNEVATQLPITIRISDNIIKNQAQ